MGTSLAGLDRLPVRSELHFRGAATTGFGATFDQSPEDKKQRHNFKFVFPLRLFQLWAPTGLTVENAIRQSPEAMQCGCVCSSRQAIGNAVDKFVQICA